MPPSEISSTGRRPNRSLSAPSKGAHRNCISENAASSMPIQTEALRRRESWPSCMIRLGMTGTTMPKPSASIATVASTEPDGGGARRGANSRR